MDHREVTREMVQESLSRGDSTGWFEELYSSVAGDSSRIPWADMRLNPNVDEWLQRREIVGSGKSALVVGCGLGDDAEELSRRGFDVVAFDVSPTAIEWCRQRFPESRVEYVVANVLDSAEHWHVKFDFVLESYTVQALPPDLRRLVLSNIAACVGPGGILLVVARGREPADNPGNLPWPVTRGELNQLKEMGLEEVAFEDYVEQEETPVRRFRVEYRRRDHQATTH